MNSSFKHGLAFALASLVSLTAGVDGSHQRHHRSAHTSRIIVSPPSTDPVYDAKGNPPDPGTKAIYSNTSGMCDHLFQVTTPSGGPISLRQWQAVRGEASATCLNGGTLVHLKLRGLIPHGVYTIWLGAFAPPGITMDFANMLGMDAFGASDGSENSFVASAKGEAELTAFETGGPYSDMNPSGTDVPSCLFDLYEFQLMGAYHTDSQTHGPHPGDPCTALLAFAFDFTQNPDAGHDGDDDDDD
jgi:hypothetical protein